MDFSREMAGRNDLILTRLLDFYFELMIIDDVH
jgi:hypothetical protein